eukprot:scaffold25112_cov50-Phaeocystis_antarctica.AAC.3
MRPPPISHTRGTLKSISTCSGWASGLAFGLGLGLGSGLGLGLGLGLGFGLEAYPHRRRFVGHRVGRHRRPIGRDGGGHRGEVSACGSLLVTCVGRHRRHDTAAAAVTHGGRCDERAAAGRRTVASPQCRHPRRLAAGCRTAAGRHLAAGGGGGGGRRAWAEYELLFGRERPRAQAVLPAAAAAAAAAASAAAAEAGGDLAPGPRDASPQRAPPHRRRGLDGLGGGAGA